MYYAISVFNTLVGITYHYYQNAIYKSVKVKKSVKLFETRNWNSRNVKFLKIAAGSAHVCLMVKEIDGQTEEHTDKWVGIVILTCTKNDYQMQRSV